jgi:NADH-quinone oxidoreductase subunit N
LLILLVLNVAESHGSALFNINTNNFLHFGKFGLLFNSICIFCTLIYVLLSGKEIEKAATILQKFMHLFSLLFVELVLLPLTPTF